MNRTTVSLETCQNYEPNRLKHSLIQSLNRLGGLYRYVQKGDRVLLKLNLLMKAKPESGITVHPQFVKAIAEILIDHGINVLIGDSPGGPFNKRFVRSVYGACGLNGIVQELRQYILDRDLSVSIGLNQNFDSVERKFDGGQIIRRLTLCAMINDVDKIISVSKLKTHGMMVFTGAVKNLFGLVPGVLKVEYHFKMSEMKTFSNLMIDICQATKPVLSIMDGIIGMEGAGPSGGDPRQIGVILASPSPYHLDRVASALIRLKPQHNPTVSESINRGLCPAALEDIDIAGASLNDFNTEKFKIPLSYGLHMAGRAPKFFQRMLDRLATPKPMFIEKRCIGCRICLEACPPKTIRIESQKARVDLNNCIRCFCCQELCPEKAVRIHRPLLMRMLAKL